MYKIIFVGDQKPTIIMNRMCQKCKSKNIVVVKTRMKKEVSHCKNCGYESTIFIKELN